MARAQPGILYLVVHAIEPIESGGQVQHKHGHLQLRPANDAKVAVSKLNDALQG